MAKYKCKLCGYIYDEEKGDERRGEGRRNEKRRKDSSKGEKEPDTK